MTPIKKPQSSYLLFCNEKRKQVMDKNPGIRIGEIQKIISVQWKELQPEEKEIYVQLAAKDKARYQQELLDNPLINDEPTAEERMTRDSNDALIAIAKASELFAQFLGTKSYEQALYRNKRQIKTSDVTRTIQTTASLDWLREDFPDVKPIQAVVTVEKKAKKDKKELPDTASFFKPRTTGETDSAE
ncbi:unnamed protein product [Peronospora farinosa]|uniref:HMG box domain-containing protein n=1 Tax=Peronospora farinosa TaxID=134698 RepID=A0ABN8BZV6_9STRA|nr:unnamed protein product [Peronospora farinosa]